MREKLLMHTLIHMLPRYKEMLFVYCLIVLTSLPSAVSGQESYRFERMWPALPQPWNFYEPQGVAIAPDGSVYIADSGFYRIQKFNANGQFITLWGREGTGNGEFGGCVTWCLLPSGPKGIAVGSDGSVYVTDTHNHRIQKFSSYGSFIAKWGKNEGDGSPGMGDREFQYPAGVAVDASGYVYVADYQNHRVQKLTSEGTFITKWGRNGGDGTYGEGEGEFFFPTAVTVDFSGFVYVSDGHNHRIQKFASDGTFITTWDNSLPGGARFGFIHDITTDGNGNIFVADTGGGSYPPIIHKINPSGQLIDSWDIQVVPSGVTAKGNYVYVSHLTGAAFGITQLTLDGSILNFWTSYKLGEDTLRLPEGIGINPEGNVYISDPINDCIHVYTSDGIHVTPPWGEHGNGNGQLDNPWGMALDDHGALYVCDQFNNRIQKFSPDGQFITTWGSGDDLPLRPEGIALDCTGNVYVTDHAFEDDPVGNRFFHHRVQKFTPNEDRTSYTFVEKWETWGDGKAFRDPSGIAVATDSLGIEYIYVADKKNSYIHKFGVNGDYFTTWTEAAVGDPFNQPHGVASDTTGNIYVADSGNYRILKFSPEGNLITSWGSHGSWPGQMGLFHSIAVGSDEKVFVADMYNNRIQVFTKTEGVGNNKAVIVAGGGPYAGNNLWDATQMTANFAYRTLRHQGFDNQDIYYLSPDTDLDIDRDGHYDVDEEANSENLRGTLATLSEDESVDSVIIYLTDHGGYDTFKINGEEILHAADNPEEPGYDLTTWLDALTPKRVTVVYDACQSGSFLDDLRGVDNRIILTSAGPEEQAKFLNQGTISFSHFFWTGIFNGFSIKESYENAKEAVNIIADQTPDAWWDTLNIDFENTYIGNHVTDMVGDAPSIGAVSSSPGEITIENSTQLNAYNVTDPGGIAHVWAVIWPPNHDPGPADNPLLTLPKVDLFPAGDGHYQGTYSGFNAMGNYQVAIYASDTSGSTSPPRFTSVSKNLTRRAIILAGAAKADTAPSREMIEDHAQLAYKTLIDQGFDPVRQIFFMSASAIDGFDAEPTNHFLRMYLEALPGNTGGDNLDLTIYLVGAGEAGTFTMNESQEVLAVSQLDRWLDNLQNDIGTSRVTLIYDGNKSGSFIPNLLSPYGKERIVITSTDSESTSYYNTAGNISFSSFFWNQVASGASLGNAFLHARQAIYYCSRLNDISFSCYQPQRPLLDANGNGDANEPTDYQAVGEIRIGDGILIADDPPEILSASLTRDGEMITITVAAKDIISTASVERVWAIIQPVSYCPDNAGEWTQGVQGEDLDFFENGGDTGAVWRYQGFCPQACKVTLYAMSYDLNDKPNISLLPLEARVYQEEGQDIYEPDNDYEQAQVIVVHHPTPQPHNFHQVEDEDWVRFYGVAGQEYTIEASNFTENCPAIELYHEDDLIVPKAAWNAPPVNGKAWIDYLVPPNESGIYYIKLYWEGLLGSELCNFEDGKMNYDLKVYDPDIGLTAIIAGKVKNRISGDPIEGAVIKSSGIGATISTRRGQYLLSEIPGSWTMRTRKDGYVTSRTSIRIASVDDYVREDISMLPHSCETDPECDDGDFCNGAETCSYGTCAPGTYPCPDDGLYCNGEEGCDEVADSCTHSGSPCPGDLDCVEETNQCVEKPCTGDGECDDGEFCNGSETCVAGTCQAGTNPCSDPTPVCDEVRDLCVEGPSITLLPNPYLQSRWMPMIFFMRIVGTNTHFDSSSEVAFDPPGAVMALLIFGDNEHLLMIGLLMPKWITPVESLQVTVKTGTEIVPEELKISSLFRKGNKIREHTMLQ